MTGGRGSFKVGDIVQLKSGGPKMTVDKIFGDSYRCIWFSGSKREVGDFSAESIVPADQEASKK